MHWARFEVEHCPQAPDVWQAGVAPPHSVSPAQARQVCVVVLQTGLVPPHSALLMQLTQVPLGTSQAGVAPVHLRGVRRPSRCRTRPTPGRRASHRCSRRRRRSCGRCGCRRRRPASSHHSRRWPDSGRTCQRRCRTAASRRCTGGCWSPSTGRRRRTPRRRASRRRTRCRPRTRGRCGRRSRRRASSPAQSASARQRTQVRVGV